jgi:hypothetical protein
MASTKDKVQKALSEVRTLILGVQILFGFQYQSLAAANRGMDLGCARKAGVFQPVKVRSG